MARQITSSSLLTSTLAQLYSLYGSFAFSGFNTTDPNLFVIMFCQPTISIAKVYATLSVDRLGIIGGLVGPPQLLESYLIGSKPSDPTVADIPRPPLNGIAQNGYIYGVLINEMGDFEETQPSTWCTPFICTLIMPFADT